MDFHRSGSCKSSEAYWMVIHQSGSCKSGESYREGFVPAKVEVDRLFYQNSLFTGGIMKQNRLSLYTVNMKLIRNYHNQGDDRVFSVSPQTGKNTRPFVGIVVICDDKQYCIPLSSPKEKHKSMKNSIDFHRMMTVISMW